MTEEKKPSSRALDLLSWLGVAALEASGDDQFRTVRSFEQKGERAIEMWLRGMCDQGLAEFVLPGLPHADGDTRVFQGPCPWLGAIDLAIYHQDGTASVIEIKDGARGPSSVRSGIGQITYAAAHMNPGVRVRRALAWTPMASPAEDERMAKACEMAGVVPVLLPSEERRKEFHRLLAVWVAKGVMKEMGHAQSQV